MTLDIQVMCTVLVLPKDGYFVGECDRVINAACGLRCNPGFNLRGSGIRMCSVNGTWTGKQPTCECKWCFLYDVNIGMIKLSGWLLAFSPITV